MGKYDDLIKMHESIKEEINGYDYDKLFHDRVEVWSSILIAEIVSNIEQDIDFNIDEAVEMGVNTISRNVFLYRSFLSNPNLPLFCNYSDIQFYLAIIDKFDLLDKSEFDNASLETLEIASHSLLYRGKNV